MEIRIDKETRKQIDKEKQKLFTFTLELRLGLLRTLGEMERQRDRGTERRRDGEMEQPKDREMEGRRDAETEVNLD